MSYVFVFVAGLAVGVICGRHPDDTRAAGVWIAAKVRGLFSRKE